ncbi:hypothetical protein B0T26DRAFT_724769 [Lasiosphaeria miniovina]|uniref:Zn(2)-C6 fungal-type domain-containing protein n=1 Tax=Lasiosphaeria miniovina TaxID=1954250 RepID=A0AA40DM42_9PEZI|nr:uncharacterized protein B0T26DRAFT_724769 [Lasiosphaeria miniovina]KAK0705862.1 hypothetical protein B0T26DRAFT_724769 [Lasiosphaeria miniovina]
MRREQPLTLGVSSRRSACDRCRGQKLRCLRKGADPQGRCDRCAKADAQCVTSPIYHMRNYSIQGQDQGRGRGWGRGSRQPEYDAGLVPGQVDTSPVSRSSSNKRRRRHNEGDALSANAPHADRHQQLQSDYHQSWTPSTSGSAVSTKSFDRPPPLQPPVANVAPMAAAAAAAAAAVFPPPNWDSGILGLEHMLSGDNPAGTSPSSSDPHHTQPQGPAANVMPWMPYHEDVFETHPLASFTSPDLGILHDASAANDPVRHVHELSRINLDLATQVKRMVRGSPHVSLKSIIVPDCTRPSPSGDLTTPLEDMLNTTRQYLNILSSIASSPSLASSSDFNTPSSLGGFGGHVPLPQGASANPSTSSASTDPLKDSGSSNATSPSSLASAPESIATSPAAAQPDTSTLLLILVCYLHILRLHVALFTHIRQYFQIISESNDRTILPLPGLCGFDNFPLQSGNLQSTMVIHLVTNMLERIETLLGLPRELRIGTRVDCIDGGLFRTSDRFLELAEAFIRKEDVGRAEDGKGGIRSLRRDMKKAKRLLRGAIAP